MKQGFTLLELMVALTIFALIGMGAHTMLHAILKSQASENQHSRVLTQLQKTFLIMSQDIIQMDTKSAIIPDKNYAANFIRRGASVPPGASQSNIIQVAYALEDKKLKRYFSISQPISKLQAEVLMENISNFSINLRPPRAIELTLTGDDFGVISRLFEVSEP